MGSYVNSIMMSIDMYASSALGRCEFQVRGRDNRSDVVHYFNKLGSIDVVDTNLACVYPDHLIDW